MEKAIKISLAVTAIAVLTACGGGGEATQVNPIAKYAGTYYAQCEAGDGTSDQSSAKVVDSGGGNFSFDSYSSTFNDVACSSGEQSQNLGGGTITLTGSEKFKFSSLPSESILPPSICATKNEEVSLDLVKIASPQQAFDAYFYKINSYLFVLLKDGESWSGTAYSTNPNFTRDDWIDCSAPPV